MYIYSYQLGRGKSTASGGMVVYTAPSDKVVIVRDVVLTLESGVDTLAHLYSDVSGSSPSIICAVNPLKSLTTYHWSGRQVLEPGERLVVYAGAADVHYRVSGYVLG